MNMKTCFLCVYVSFNAFASMFLFRMRQIRYGENDIKELAHCTLSFNIHHLKHVSATNGNLFRGQREFLQKL